MVGGPVVAFCRLVHGHGLFFEVRVSGVDGQIVGRAPTYTKADCLTVASGDANRTISVVGRRLVNRQAGTQGPLLVDFIRRTNSRSPGVVPVLLFFDRTDGANATTERTRNPVAFYSDVFKATPACPGTTCIDSPLVVQLMSDREVNGLRRGDVQTCIVLSAVEWTETNTLEILVWPSRLYLTFEW